MGKSFPHNLSSKSERTSAFTSRGSLTVEAALVVPFFFFAMLCMVYLFEIMALRTEVRGALYCVGKEIGEQCYVSPILSATTLKSRIVSYMGSERIENSLIQDGVQGIHCYKTLVNEKTAVMLLSVEYKIQISVPFFKLPATKYEEKFCLKGWKGDVQTSDEEDDDREVVYVTESGTVYHKDMSCTYLAVKIRGIIAKTIGDARNASGGKYYECELCGKGEHYGILYVSEYGTRYHTTLSCSKIKRNVLAIPLEDVKGRKGCEKCVN